MIDFALQLWGLVVSGLILWRAEPVTNIMHAKSPLKVRLAFLLLYGGALGIIGRIFTGYVPYPVVLAALTGIALLLITERRILGLLRLAPCVTRERRRAR